MAGITSVDLARRAGENLETASPDLRRAAACLVVWSAVATRRTISLQFSGSGRWASGLEWAAAGVDRELCQGLHRPWSGRSRFGFCLCCLGARGRAQEGYGAGIA
ncbi:MAG TPA: hypothetical protein VN961_21230 [Streptosporangiaceae bacterium]|nr:hypothetical protein [Streptosporangiaceae bacterium]